MEINGKRERKYIESLGRITKAEGKIKLANFITKNKDSKHYLNKVTFRKAYDQFADYYKNLIGQSISAGTYKIFLDHCEKLLEFFSDMDLKEINFQTIEAYKIDMKKKELSNRFINMHLTELKKILEYCENIEWILDVPKIKRLPEKSMNKTIDYLKNDEILKLLENANKEQAFYLSLMIYTGMRPHEATALNWDNVDLEKNIINVESSNRLKLGRQLPLHPKLKEILLGGERTSEFVSPYRQTEYAKKAMTRIEKITQIKCNPYKLRKTFGSILARMNVTHFKTAALMGHKNVQTTFQYYTGLDDSDLAKSIGQIKLPEAEPDN